MSSTKKGNQWYFGMKAHVGTDTKKDEKENKRVSKIRAKGEHAFRVLKHLWGYSKTRYKGIAKNAAQIFMLFSLSNLNMLRHQIIEMKT
jgi:IS5 family transposase